MIKKSYLFSIASSIIMMLLFSTCAAEDYPGSEDDEEVPPNELTYTCWHTHGNDYAIGDDYISLYNRTMEICFYSSTEGYYYYHDNIDDSDFGHSSIRYIGFFNYNINGEDVYMSYFTEEDRYVPSHMKYKNGKLFFETDPDNSLQSKKIDYDFLNEYKGKTGDAKWYSTYMAVYVKGKGAMADYNSYNATPWSRHASNYVFIDDGVTHIGANAFASPSIGSVELEYGSELKTIGAKAFSGSSISSIYLPNNLSKIGSEAFLACSYLKNAIIPENITEIGNFAFSDCKNLDISFSGHDRLEIVGDHSFSGVNSIKFYKFPANLRKVGMGAFSAITTDKLDLPNSLESIGNLAFEGSMSEIRIESGLTSISGTPFYPYKSGKMYVNRKYPIQLQNDIINSDVVRNWTLYVPSGCAHLYKESAYWRNFKSIVEDSSLTGAPGESDPPQENPGDEPNEDNIDWGEVYFYTIDGAEYRMVRVEGNGAIDTFYIMQTELPHDATLKINGQNFGKLDSNGDGHVIKTELREFLTLLRTSCKVPFRLPTLKEWEYAASGGNRSKGYTYSGSNDIEDVAWYKENSNKQLRPVALKEGNELNIFDMSGNYSELCNDNQGDLYFIDGPIAGGSWNDNASNCKTSSWNPGITSGKIPGTNLREKNAFNGRYTTVRLVFSAKN